MKEIILGTLSFLLALCPDAAGTNISMISYLLESTGECCQKQVLQPGLCFFLFLFHMDKLLFYNNNVGLN